MIVVGEEEKKMPVGRGRWSFDGQKETRDQRGTSPPLNMFAWERLHFRRKPLR